MEAGKLKLKPGTQIQIHGSRWKRHHLMNNFYNRPGTKKRGSFIFKSLFCFFLSTLFLSCSASKENELNQLLKTEWKLVKLYEEELSSLSKFTSLIFLYKIGRPSHR